MKLILGKTYTLSPTDIVQPGAACNPVYTANGDAVIDITDDQVTLVAKGAATITGSDGDVVSTLDVTVEAPELTAFTAEVDNVALAPTETAQVTLSAPVPEYAEIGATTYASSDELVATVDADGVVTAVGDGVAVITATDTATGVTADTSEITVTTPEPVLESFTIDATENQ